MGKKNQGIQGINKRPPEFADSKGPSTAKYIKTHTTQINRKNQAFRRASLPSPRKYYSRYFILRKSSGWTNDHCSFHSPDKFSSLSLNPNEWHFKCHALDYVDQAREQRGMEVSHGL